MRFTITAAFHGLRRGWRFGSFTVAAIATANVLAFTAGYAAGQRQQPPPENVGLTEELLRSLDLTGELTSTAGRPLRMRKLTMQPGGALALHNHADRPAITYLLEGEMTYYEEGQPPRVIRPGGGFAEGRTTTHWGQNTGTVPAVWVAVDIPLP